jgi:inorganic pyrophosphatase
MMSVPPRDARGRWLAVIESPQGSRNKIKLDHELDAFRVTQSLPAGMSFPFDFGFVPGTRAQDGDPLDVLILMDAPAYPGTVVRIRLLGVIEAEQEDDGRMVRNDRLIALARGSTERGAVKRLKDLQPALLDQIEAFFVDYNRLRGKAFHPLGRRGRRAAHRILEQTTIDQGAGPRDARRQQRGRSRPVDDRVAQHRHGGAGA